MLGNLKVAEERDNLRAHKNHGSHATLKSTHSELGGIMALPQAAIKTSDQDRKNDASGG
jgi:hypothetical protein